MAKQFNFSLLLSDGALYQFEKSCAFKIANNIKAVGIEYILPRDGNFNLQSAHIALKLIENYKLPIPIVHAPLTLSYEIIEKTIEFVRVIKPEGVILHPGEDKFVRLLIEKLQDEKIQPLIENLLLSREPKKKAYFPRESYYLQRSLIDTCKSISAKLALDLHHVLVNGMDIIQTVEKFKSIIGHLHISADSHMPTQAKEYLESLFLLNNSVKYLTVEMAVAANLKEFSKRTEIFIQNLMKGFI